VAGGRSNRVPRCPVCKALLSTDRTIDERWTRRHPGPDLWVYRLSCAQCLTISSVEIPEVSALVRSEPGPPAVDVAGAVVARVLERLRAASGPGELAEIHRAAREEREHRVLLRVPEVAALLRPAYGERAWTAEDLVVDWPALHDSSRPSGRLTLRRSTRTLPPDAVADPVVMVGEALELRLRAGMRLRILGFEGGALLLAPPREDPDLKAWLTEVEALVAWSDFVSPGSP
jgi:hypothetical protein